MDLEPSGTEPLAAVYQVTIISEMPVFNAPQELSLMERPVPLRLTPRIIALLTRSS